MTVRFVPSRLRWIGSHPLESCKPTVGGTYPWGVYKKLYQDSHEAGRVNAVSGEGMILFSDSLHLRSLELNRLVIKNILNSSDPICAVASRVDSRLCAVGLQSGKILLIDPESKSILRELDGHMAPVRSIQFLRNQSMLASVSDDMSVRTWDVSTGACLSTTSDHKDFVRTLSASKTSDIFVCGSYDHLINIFDCNTTHKIATFDHGEPVDAVACMGRTVVSGGKTSVKVWTLDPYPRLLNVMSAHTKAVTSIAMTNDERFFITSSLDKSVKVVCSTTWRTVRQYRFNSPVANCSLSQDSKLLSFVLLNGDLVVLHRLRRDATAVLFREESYSNNQLTQNLAVEKGLRRFSYHHALRSAISSGKPALVCSVIGELIRRNVLRRMLTSEPDTYFVILMNFCLKYLKFPRFASLCIDLSHEICMAVEMAPSAIDSKTSKLFKTFIDMAQLELHISSALDELRGFIEIY